jgi:hypothetical protein
MPRPYPIFLLTVVDFDGRLVKFELIVFVFIIAICVYIGRNGGNGLILVDTDQVLNNFGLRGHPIGIGPQIVGICAIHFGPLPHVCSIDVVLARPGDDVLFLDGCEPLGA